MGDVIPISVEEEESYQRSRARRGRGNAPESPSARAGLYNAPERVLPHSLEAEEYLLYCCMLPDTGEETLAKCLQAGIRVGSFYLAAHGAIFGTFLELSVARRPIDVSVVAEVLRAAGREEAFAVLLQVSAKNATSAQASLWIEWVRGYALRREIIRTAVEVTEDAYKLPRESGVDEFAAGVSQKILALTGTNSGLPPMVEDGALMVEVLPEPPMLVDKVCHVGGVCLLVAPSKASKTFTAMDMSVAVASGQAWLGFKTHAGPVLHIDFELPKWDLKKRGAKLKELRGIHGNVPITWWSLRGKVQPIERLVPLIVSRAPRGKYALIVLEPAYVILGKRDENDNADVTDFMNHLFAIAEATGSSVLCTHHMAKGDHSKKDSKDRGSGAGAWVRAPDTAITLTPLADEQGEDCFVMEFIERSMKRHAPVGVQFEYPVFRCKSGLDLNAVREPGRPKESTERDVVRALGDETLTHGEWMKACRVGESGQISERTFNRRVKEAMDAGLVVKSGPIYRRAKGAE